MNPSSKLYGREQQAADLYASGMSVREISVAMECGSTAVKTALRGVGVVMRSRSEAGVIAMEYKTLSVEERNRRERGYHASWVERNRESLRAYQIKWREANKDSIVSYSKKWSSDNRERTSANKRKWRSENPQKHKGLRGRTL